MSVYVVGAVCSGLLTFIYTTRAQLRADDVWGGMQLQQVR